MKQDADEKKIKEQFDYAVKMIKIVAECYDEELRKDDNKFNNLGLQTKEIVFAMLLVEAIKNKTVVLPTPSKNQTSFNGKGKRKKEASSEVTEPQSETETVDETHQTQ